MPAVAPGQRLSGGAQHAGGSSWASLPVARSCLTISYARLWSAMVHEVWGVS